MASRDEIAAWLRAWLRDEMEIAPDRVTPEAELRDDLGLDSLDALHLELCAQEHFELAMPAGGLDGAATCGQVEEAIERLLSGQLA